MPACHPGPFSDNLMEPIVVIQVAPPTLFMGPLDDGGRTSSLQKREGRTPARGSDGGSGKLAMVLKRRILPALLSLAWLGITHWLGTISLAVAVLGVLIVHTILATIDFLSIESDHET